MNCAGDGSAFRERSEDGIVESAAGMEDNLAAPLVPADACEFRGNFRNYVVGSGNEHDVRVKDAAGDARERETASDGSNRGASGGVGTRNNGANFPVRATQAAAENASQAAGSYDGDCGGHCA